jgi:branched-chain amino acid transport system ATP-binding protein
MGNLRTLAVPMKSDIILGTQNLTKRFGDFTAVSEVSVEFERSRLTAIIGPNGAGKSTFFNMLTGAHAPTSGKIFFEGKDITGIPQHRFAHLGIAKSFQITSIFPELSVFENVRLAAQARVTRFDIWSPRSSYYEIEEKADGVLREVGLLTRRNDLAATLSHGEQRALEVGMALASDPRLLLLDEPTSGMSPDETRTMMALILKFAERRTVILVEHKMKLVMTICERVIVLHHGEMLAVGTPEEVREDEMVKRVYLGRRKA